MAFSMEERKRIVAENPSMKSDIGGVAKMVGKAWGALSAEEKAKYAKKGASMKTKKVKKTKNAKKGVVVEEETAKKGKTRKSGKKRALSGFMKFSMKERAAVLKENPGIAFGAVGKELGKRWGALSDAEKKKFA